MDYAKLNCHYRPHKGWMSDPNGLVFFHGYYHIFYQHAPDYEIPWKEPMHWGHARTKDFLNWEELPVALYPDREYDSGGCWSGTAIVKDDVLYLFYASVCLPEREQKVCVAYSRDGIHFEKYAQNPVIDHYPPEGGRNFRDPALCFANGAYYCVMATGNEETKTGRLLLYKSRDLFEWTYDGIMCQWENCHYTECPSFVPAENGLYLLTASVCPLDDAPYFAVMYGDFQDGKFTVRCKAEVDKGPDQYAGQVFRDHKGRNLLMTWIPGWNYSGYADRDIGCMSVPRELTLQHGKIRGYPVEELRHLLTSSDECVKRTEDGFILKRSGRAAVVYKGPITQLDILRDAYIAEVFVNAGEEIYSALL